MSNSALAKYYIPAADCNHRGSRKVKIAKIIVHHAAGVISADNLAKLFANPNRKASATYCIGNDGTIVRGLDENIAPGTSGSYEADKDAVTIEVSNSKTGEPWQVSDAAMNSLIKLCADIAKRNSLGNLVKGKNLCWHSMYAATACPGRFLLSKMDYIASEANKLNAPAPTTVAATGVVTGIDIGRGTDALVLYKTGTNGKTGTNKWGTEVALDKNFKVLSVEYGKGNMAIPSGGCVLSGHGKSSDWLLNNAKKGKTLTLKATV